MDLVVNPWVLYAGLAVGAVGVAMALPRPRVNPQALGALVAFIGFGAVLLSMGLRAGDQRPGFYFYLFSLIALGSGLRVISHPRPVYAALYFILTVLASSALYLMLHAEFLAFALIIIYAGAILITYLFVIMLAQEASTESELEELASYDRFSREPVVAAGVGFVLLALLTGMMAKGVASGEPAPSDPRGTGVELVERMPKKVVDSLERAGVFADTGIQRPTLADVPGLIDTSARTIGLQIADEAAFEAALVRPGFGEMVAAQRPGVAVLRWPSGLREENLDGVGFALIASHPMALELAGVILLMAMLGAVVLSRKQIEISEAEKEAAVRRLASGEN